jgi:hypothetical protein
VKLGTLAAVAGLAVGAALPRPSSQPSDVAVSRPAQGAPVEPPATPVTVVATLVDGADAGPSFHLAAGTYRVRITGAGTPDLAYVTLRDAGDERVASLPGKLDVDSFVYALPAGDYHLDWSGGGDPHGPWPVTFTPVP